MNSCPWESVIGVYTVLPKYLTVLGPGWLFCLGKSKNLIKAFELVSLVHKFETGKSKSRVHVIYGSEGPSHGLLKPKKIVNTWSSEPDKVATFRRNIVFVAKEITDNYKPINIIFYNQNWEKAQTNIGQCREYSLAFFNRKHFYRAASREFKQRTVVSENLLCMLERNY